MYICIPFFPTPKVQIVFINHILIHYMCLIKVSNYIQCEKVINQIFFSHLFGCYSIIIINEKFVLLKRLERKLQFIFLIGRICYLLFCLLYPPFFYMCCLERYQPKMRNSYLYPVISLNIHIWFWLLLLIPSFSHEFHQC